MTVPRLSTLVAFAFLVQPATAQGDRVAHRFAKAGQYLVTVTGSREGSEVVNQQVPVFVGLKPEEGLVCRLLMKGALRDGLKSWIWLSTWDKVEYHLIPDASGAGNVGFLAGGSWMMDDRRGTVLELYLDGQKVAEGTAAALGAHPGDVNLGRCGNTLFHDRRAAEQPGHYFARRVDDFRIANRALPAAEVRTLAGAR